MDRSHTGSGAGVAQPQKASIEDGAKNTNMPCSYHQPTNSNLQGPNIKAGFSVSKKSFKKATDRNRIKRLFREAFRQHKGALNQKLAEQNCHCHVFFIFTDKALPNYLLIEQKMKYCLRRLCKIVEGGT